MAVQERAAPRAVSRHRIDISALVSCSLIGLAARRPRVLALGLFITDDEANFWLTRSDIFLKAIRTGDFAATAITAHPGVTTMWLGPGPEVGAWCAGDVARRGRNCAAARTAGLGHPALRCVPGGAYADAAAGRAGACRRAA